MRRFLSRDDLLSPRQAAAHLGVPVRTIQYLAERGRLAYETLDSGSRRPMRRFRKSALDRLVVERRSA